MSKGVIDFALMDRSKVAVLCLNPIHIRQMVTQLEDQGKKVKIETSLTSFFSYLETSTPGFILVSRSVKTGMGNQLAGFLQRKFKVPVLTFSEVIEVPDEKGSPNPHRARATVGSAVPEILHISERARPEEILSKIENFQMTYQ
ncbi:MAG: hypothetical protein LW875_11900, partial [Proteobacteria bacterium]|nr:hypothetical protein [Pseudomonadota bacterium]